MTEKKITSELVVPKEGEIKVRFEKKKKELGGLRESLDAMGERANHLKEELRLLEEELVTIDTAGDEETDAVKLQLTNLEIKITNFGKKIDRTKKVIEVKERNEKVFQSLEQALALIKKKLEGLSDEEGRGLKWIVRSIEYALSNKGEDGRIEVKDEDGNLQREGVPVDQLIEELKKIKNDAEETEKKNKEIGLLRERINYLNKARQNSREGEAVYFLVLGKDHINGDDKIPDFLKPFIAKRSELLARFDVGLKHDDKYKYHDTGSAAHDLVEYLAIETEKELVSLESSGDREAEAKRLAEFLTKHSKGYFELRPEMKGEKQHWRTRLEARLISSDHRSTGGVESDYKKAMETMSA